MQDSKLVTAATAHRSDKPAQKPNDLPIWICLSGMVIGGILTAPSVWKMIMTGQSTKWDDVERIVMGFSMVLLCAVIGSILRPRRN